MYFANGVQKIGRGMPFIFFSLFITVLSIPVLAIRPVQPPDGFDWSMVKDHGIHVTSWNIPYPELSAQLPNALAWEEFIQLNTRPEHIFIDPRTGAPTNILLSIPIIPGTGKNNHLDLMSISRTLGEPVSQITPDVVDRLMRQFIKRHASVLQVNVSELAEPRIVQVSDYLWHVIYGRSYQGVPVRKSLVSAVINHGNLVMIGTELWQPIKGLNRVQITAGEALDVVFRFMRRREPEDRVTVAPHLEIVPLYSGEPDVLFYRGPIGEGLRYRYAWVFVIQRGRFGPRWEAIVDAETGELLGFQDLNQYVKKQIKGGVYPVSNDGIPPDGVEQAGFPMPFADTGLPAPNNYTNSAGLFEWTSGTVTTTLNGRYIRIADQCGSISESSTTGDVDLGTSGGTDCTVPPGHSSGDTHAARSGFYELNRIKELGRGWLTTNSWLNAQLTANMNINNQCNATWNGTEVNFYRSGGGCRNTGEIAAIFDHEWGHGMDDNDSNGSISSPGEAIADIYAAYRLHTSCIGRGFFWTLDRGCGQDSLGTGYNCSGYGDCCINCTGVREIDYARHASGQPHTPQNFIQPNCPTQTLCGILSCCGPCNRECHCEGMIPAEAGWDFAARDLQAPPFSFDENTAFIIANRTTYFGSGLITNWYSCSGGGSSSNGCGSNNGYMQWLAADDDNGDITDGTPHMEALFNAFNRHGIACSSPAVQNSGCSTGPTTAPFLTVIPGDNQVTLTWNAVSNATAYWVFRGEGPNGCSFGKVKIAEVSTTNYTDTEVANGLNYHYVVMPVGTNSACMGPASNCETVSPTSCTPPSAPSNLTASTPADNTVRLNWTGVSGVTEYRIYRSTTSGGPYTMIASVPSAQTSYDDTTVQGGVVYYYVVRAFQGCESSDSNEVSITATGVCTLSPSFSGASSAVNAESTYCGIQLSWNSAVSNCPTQSGITYAIYRDTTSGFTPSPANLIARCVTGTSYLDQNGLVNGTTYYYIVRAEDSGNAGTGPCNNGNMDGNTLEVSAMATGPRTLLYSEDFEGPTTGWQHSTSDSTCTTGDWVVGDPEGITNGGVVTQLEDDHTPAPGVNAFFTAHNSGAGTDDVDGGVCTGYSPVINVSGYPTVDIEMWYFHGQRDAGDDPNGDFFRIDLSTDGGSSYTTNLVSIGDVTSDASWTRVTYQLSGGAQIRFRVQASDGPSAGDLVEGGIDDIVVNGTQACSSVTGAPGEPGTSVALTVTKSGGNLVFSWGAPDPGCTASDYALYKGDLGILKSTGYNHDTVITCSTGGSTTYSVSLSDPKIGAMDYYIVVGLNGTHESSYGRDSKGIERPVSSSACRVQQNTNACF